MNQVETNIEVESGPRERSTVLFRAIIAFPTLIFLGSFSTTHYGGSQWMSASGLIVAPAFLALLFRGKYPSYVLTFNRSIMELSLRVFAYFFLLTEDFPSIEANPKFTITFPEIDEGKKLNQFLPLVKWLLAIPLYIVGFIYLIYAGIVTIAAWFTILGSGYYPDWAREPVIGTIQYWNRVTGYAFALVTDEYPSFSL
jgi:hypothetical protein